MGEYAEMEIFAQMRGKTTSDLTVSEIREFYREHDRAPSPPPPRRMRCPICGKTCKSEKGLHVHTEVKHGA